VVGLICNVYLKDFANVAGVEVMERIVLLDDTFVDEVFRYKVINVNFAAYKRELSLFECGCSIDKQRGQLGACNLVFVASGFCT